MKRMIDLNRREYKRQVIRVGAWLNMARVIPLILLVPILFFQYCSVHHSAQKSKGVKLLEVTNNAGKRWAICIGINDYKDSTIIDLNNARNDARELATTLEQYGQFDNIYVFTDDYDPTDDHYPKKINITRKLDFIKRRIRPEDMILFSFSGHGVTSLNGEGYLMTVDSYIGNFGETSLKVKDIVGWINETNVRKALLLLDACRERFQQGRGIRLNGLQTERFSQAELVAIFYATKDGGFSYEDEESNFGVFTKYIIQGLKGEADTSKTGNGDGIVAFSELVPYVEEKVTKWASDTISNQRPYTQICKERFGDLLLSINPGNIKTIGFLELASEVIEKYNKDLKKFIIRDFPKGLEVRGKITLKIDVSYNGNITIRSCNTEALKLESIEAKDSIKKVIQGEIMKKKLIPPIDSRGTLVNLEKCELVYIVRSSKDKIKLLELSLFLNLPEIGKEH